MAISQECMQMAREQAKYHYNKWLDRHYKALTFFADNGITIEEKEKWIPNYRDITMALGELLDFIGDYTEDEALNGFEVKDLKKVV